MLETAVSCGSLKGAQGVQWGQAFTHVYSLDLFK
jgi:hypothetical protein